MASLAVKMASLTVEKTSEEEALSVLEELRIKIFGNEYFYFYILQFIYLDAKDGKTNFSHIENITDGLAAVVVQSPNYYGILEDWSIAKKD